MRHMKMILTTLVLAAAAGLVLASAAPAGDFADEPCVDAGGDIYLCPVATQGAGYSVQFKLKESEGCDRFRVTSGDFPPGLTLSSDDGIARGTPSRAGSFVFYITVDYPTCPNPKNASDRRFQINVNPQVLRMFVATNGLPDASIGQAYAPQQLTTGNGAANSWALATGSLPPGVQLSSGGVISGTPTASGIFSFTVQANGANNTDTRQLSIFVLAPLELQTLTGKKPPMQGLTAKAALNAPLTTGVKVVGGRGPYTFSSVGALPPGLELNLATGAITGIGTVAGRFTSTVSVADQAGGKASVPFSFTILPLLDFIKGKNLPTGKLGRFYVARIPIKGKDARIAQFALSGRIPPGLELDERGRLSGQLLLPGSFRVKVYAFGASGAPITKFFTIRVKP